MNFSEKHTCLLVQGSQAAEFLQGQITIDVEKISNEDFIAKLSKIEKIDSLLLLEVGLTIFVSTSIFLFLYLPPLI